LHYRELVADARKQLRLKTPRSHSALLIAKNSLQPATYASGADLSIALGSVGALSPYEIALCTS
jgi:hypothetical protein